MVLSLVPLFLRVNQKIRLFWNTQSNDLHFALLRITPYLVILVIVLVWQWWKIEINSCPTHAQSHFGIQEEVYFEVSKLADNLGI